MKNRKTQVGMRQHKFLIGGIGLATAIGFVGTAANAVPAPSATPKPVNCAPADGVTASTITLGYFMPKTGAAAPTFGGADQAAQLRIDQENAKGGINGRKIKMIVYDDQASGATQVSQATKAMQGDKVFGLMMTSATDSAFPTFKANNIPVTGFNVLAMSTDRNAFSVTGPPATGLISTAILERLKQEGAGKIALISHNTPGAVNSIKSMAAAVPLSGTGMTNPLTILDEPQGAHDATSTALRIKNSGADSAYPSMFVDGAISIQQALIAQGVKLKAYYLGGLSDPSVISKAGSVLEGVIGSTYGTVPAGVPGKPGVRTFINGMKSAGLNPYTPIAPIGFAATDLMLKGLRLAGPCPTRELFVNNLRKVTNYDANGLIPEKISFTPGVTPMGTPAKCSWFLVVKNGVPVPDSKPTCGKLVNTLTGQVVG